MSLIYLPPILISLIILYPFAKSLSPSYIPLITQFYYLTEVNLAEYSEVKDEAKTDTTIGAKKVYYTTILTWIWLALISLMLLEIVLLSFFAPLKIWSLFTNFINYFILLAFMLGEWLFRAIYFKQWSSPLIFIKQLILIDHQKLLQKKE